MSARPGRWAARCSIGTAVLVSACGPEKLYLPWPEIAPGEVQVFAFIEQGSLRTQHGPFTDEPPDGVGLKELQSDGVQLHHVVLEVEALGARVPAFDVTRISELQLDARAPGCTGVERREGARVIGLEPGFATHAVFDGEAFVERPVDAFPLALWLPIDEAACVGAHRSRFVRFGAEPQAIPDRLMPLSTVLHRKATQLGPDRIVVGDWDGLFIVDRGGTESSDPTRRWDAASHERRNPNQGSWYVLTFAIDHRRSSPERARIIVIIKASGLLENSYFYDVVELWWTPAGFGSERTLFQTELDLIQVFVARDGRTHVFGDGGTYLIQTSTTANFAPADDLGLGRVNLTDSAEQSSSTEPLVLVDSGHSLYFGTARPGEPFRSEVGAPVASGARSLVILGAAPERRRYFTDTESPELVVREPDRRRELFQVQVPPSLGRCAAPPDACGERSLGGRRLSVVATEHETLLVVPTLCAVILEVEPVRGCVRTVEYDAPAWPEGSENTRASLWRAHDGTITLTGRGGVVLELQGDEG